MKMKKTRLLVTCMVLIAAVVVGLMLFIESRGEKGVFTFTGLDGPVAFSADGRYALLGGDEGTLEWWDVLAGECLRTFYIQDRTVEEVAVSPDGRHALSVTSHRYYNVTQMWDTSTGGCLWTHMGGGSSPSVPTVSMCC